MLCAPVSSSPPRPPHGGPLVLALLLLGAGPEASPAQLTKDCETGDPNACSELGVLFAHGRGVAKDEARAATAYTKACDGGDTYACFNLGLLFERGDGVSKDEARAASAYARGSTLGSQPSCSKAQKK